MYLIIYLYRIALYMGRNNYNHKKIPIFRTRLRVITLFKFVLAPSMLPGLELDYMCLCLYIKHFLHKYCCFSTKFS